MEEQRWLVKQFLAGLPSGPSIEHLSIEDLKIIERLVALEQALQKTLTELDVSRADAAARLGLLKRITWMAAGIVAVDLILLALVVVGSISTSYKPDEWFVRLLAGGPLTAIIGMLGAIVAHYWPGRKGKRQEDR